LALFGRRPLARLDGLGIPASENTKATVNHHTPSQAVGSESEEVHIIDRPSDDVCLGVAQTAQRPSGTALANARLDGSATYDLPFTAARIKEAIGG
jgi:hypothetical protein